MGIRTPEQYAIEVDRHIMNFAVMHARPITGQDAVRICANIIQIAMDDTLENAAAAFEANMATSTDDPGILAALKTFTGYLRRLKSTTPDLEKFQFTEKD